MAEESKDKVFDIVENADGTATILSPGQSPGESAAAKPADSQVSGQGPDDGDDADSPGDGPDDTGDDTTSDAGESLDSGRAVLRQQRRDEKKRKRSHQRNALESANRRISSLEQTINQLSDQLGGISSTQQRANLGQVAAAVQNLEAREQELTSIIGAAEASPEQRAEATRQLVNVVQRKAGLAAVKDRAERDMRADPGRAGGVSRARPDPAIVSNATAWMGQNRWFTVDGHDDDSRVARTIDAGLTQEGWDPRTPAYWDEFNSRLGRYLPHRISGYDPTGNRLSGDGGKPLENGSGLRPGPRGPTGGGAGQGGAGNGSGGFTLSVARVQAIKDAGMWDDPKQRAKMIQRYHELDRKPATAAR